MRLDDGLQRVAQRIELVGGERRAALDTSFKSEREVLADLVGGAYERADSLLADEVPREEQHAVVETLRDGVDVDVGEAAAAAAVRRHQRLVRANGGLQHVHYGGQVLRVSGDYVGHFLVWFITAI